MVGWGHVTGRAMLPKGKHVLRVLQQPPINEPACFSLVYPWNTLPTGTVICDVGGGNGHAMLSLLKAFPHLRAVVQDLKAAVDDGEKVGDTRFMVGSAI